MAAVAFVINHTRAGDLRWLRRECASAAGRAGLEPLFYDTAPAPERAGHHAHLVGDLVMAGADQTQAAVAAGASLVAAVGGDGTVRACAHALAGGDVPLAIIPLGTANLAATALGVPSRPGAALAAGLTGRDRRIDVGEADGLTFLAMAGIGLDAEVVAATPPLLKAWFGWPAYAAAGAVRALGTRRAFTIRLDGAEPLIRDARSVVAANAGLLPGGFALLPEAVPDDGMLDAGILAPASVTDWARVARRVLTKDRHDGPELERHQARQIEILAPAPLPRQVDGEVISPATSFSITIRPAALTVRVPF